MKAYTDLEQSKKLTKILPSESADMYWSRCTIADFGGGILKFVSYAGEPFYISKFRNTKEDIPCWSLAALLQVLPLGIYDEFDNCDYELEIDMIDKMPRYIRLGDIYHSQFPYDFEKDTLLDNVVESIIWLNDNNYFEL